MGIIISYDGRLNKAAQLPEVLAWLHEQSDKLKWRCTDMTQEVSGILLRRAGEGKTKPELIETVVKGVYVQPPGCETLLLMFDPSGLLVNYFEIPDEMLMPAAQARRQTHYLDGPNWCKTTGEARSHMFIVMILHDLKKKFMRNLKVKDDTGYWKTGSLSDLMSSHQAMAGFLAAFDNPAVLKSVLGASGVEVGDETRIEKLDPKLSITPVKRRPRKEKVN